MQERSGSLRRTAAALLLVATASLAASPALADEYDARRAGHPLRVVAYVLHPIGVTLDYLLFRPAHWVGSLPVIRTVFGHEVDEQPQR
jgi:hypothetical protein